MEQVLERAKEILQTTPSRWESLVEQVHSDLLFLAPAAGEWSAVECLQHLVDTESVFQFRVHCFMEGRDFPAFDPDTAVETSAARPDPVELAAAFSRMRTQSLNVLLAVSDQDLERRVRHQELGPVSLEEMIHEWAAHDLNHTIQAERALMQPFIRGSGPWQRYFTDHMIAVE